jgi:hypothetical protein
MNPCRIFLIVPILAAQFAGPGFLRGMALDERIGTGEFWNLDAAGLTAALQKTPFRWVSQDRSELRAGASGMTYLDLPVAEAVIRLKDGKPEEVFLSLYNRGDLGQMVDERFDEFVAQTDKVLTGRAGVPSEDLGDVLKRSGIRATSKAWIGQSFSARLDTAYSRVKEEGERGRQNRPEFVNLTLYPPGTVRESMLVQRKADTAPADLRQRVKKQDNGDVLIEGVPMVDQGKKGYCAVATMERILRYYGSEVNQHELAQQADSSGDKGTDPESLIKALRGMGSKLGLRVDERESMDTKGFLDLVEDYNKAAKKQKEPEIRLGAERVINISEVFASMKVPVLREARIKSGSKVDKFFKETVETVDLGRPMAWSVQLGWIEEMPRLPQVSGGHMRLIVGYNPEKKEILYSDSWGYGHELKRMALEDAYLITTGLFVVEPRG